MSKLRTSKDITKCPDCKCIDYNCIDFQNLKKDLAIKWMEAIKEGNKKDDCETLFKENNMSTRNDCCYELLKHIFDITEEDLDARNY